MPLAWRELTDLARTDLEKATARARHDCEAELRLLASDPERWLGDWEVTAPLADRAIVADPAIRAMYVESCREATVEGYARDLLILTALPWGFRLDDVAVPSFLWHGEEDTAVPVEVARWAVRRLPLCEARIAPGEGHLLVHPRAGEILGTLAGSLT